MRVVFLGTPDFAVPSLEALLSADGLDVVAVFTQPDRPRGRGLKVSPSPVKKLAVERSLPVHQPARIRGNPRAVQSLSDLRADVAVVVAFGQLLPQEFFSVPPLGTVNLHASLLPAYRGAAPAAHAIWRGESVTGVTIMKIDEGMDSGDVLACEEVAIGPEMTAGELEAVLAVRGARLLVRTLPDYAAGRLRPRPQDHSAATLAPLLKKEDGRVDWKLPAAAAHNQIRALNPRPGAFCLWGGEPLKLWRSRLGGEAPAAAGAGEVIVRDGELGVVCGDGVELQLLEVQLPNRRRTAAREFLNGVELAGGERFQ